jgi:hypothetical protein
MAFQKPRTKGEGRVRETSIVAMARQRHSVRQLPLTLQASHRTTANHGTPTGKGISIVITIFVACQQGPQSTSLFHKSNS